MDLNAYSEMKTYLSFFLETTEIADTSLPLECHTSTCGNCQETNIRMQDTLNSAAMYMVSGNKFEFNTSQDTAGMHIQTD